MHRFPPLAPQQPRQQPLLSLALADLPLGEIVIMALLALFGMLV